jgi:hypothetical protein
MPVSRPPGFANLELSAAERRFPRLSWVTPSKISFKYPASCILHRGYKQVSVPRLAAFRPAAGG